MQQDVAFYVIAQGEGKPMDDGTGRRHNLIVASAHDLDREPPLPGENTFIKGPDIEGTHVWWRVRSINYEYRTDHGNQRFSTEIQVLVERPR